MSVFELMIAPFIECLILVGIHSYLGLHVIRRRVIFVDLALAQIAALGATVGFVFGILPGTTGAFLFSLTFCLIGAGLFAFTRMRDDKIPQESVIGLVYAITAALAILVVQKTKGAEHLEDILVGNLLWVKWSDIVAAAIAYSVIGLIHFVFRKQFLTISEHPDQAWASGMRVRLWDFLFYATFGFVITFSVRVAGVLLVFVFLVAPAIMAVMLSNRLRSQLLIGWATGTAVTVLGLFFSYRLDLPSGPTVVAFYGLVLLATAVVLSVTRAPAGARARPLMRAVVGLVVVAGVGLALRAEGKLLASLPDNHSGHHQPPDQTAPVAPPEPAQVDPSARIEALRNALAADPHVGAGLLVALLAAQDLPPFFKQEAIDLVAAKAGSDFGLRAEGSAKENEEALGKLRAWAESR